jgi:nucleoside-diphosphate-sugar epimerase
MKVLITGGAGFIGRSVVRKFLIENNDVWVLDNLSNGSRENISEFLEMSNFHGLIEEDITNPDRLKGVFENQFDLIIHMAAQINVQTSLDNPDFDFMVNVIGTQNILNEALKSKTKTVILGTCMVYDMASANKAIDEEHPVKPKSPYAGSKLMAENLALSYYFGFGLPVVILRPFNVYGPFQKSNLEGGVVSIFVDSNLNGKYLNVYGDGTQTRDLLYVEDCANFIYSASMNDTAVGEILNAGSGRDVAINELANLVAKDESKIKHVEHIHPGSEIPKLLCDYSKSNKLLGWKPEVSLEEGIRRTEDWLSTKN